MSERVRHVEVGRAPGPGGGHLQCGGGRMDGTGREL